MEFVVHVKGNSMKWIYVIVGVLLFLLIGKLIGDYSKRGVSDKVEIIHSGAQP